MVNRISGLVEVLLVALLGSFVAQFILGSLGVTSAEILNHSRWLFLFLVCEASLTLLLVTLLLRGRGESFRSLGWDWSQLWKEVRIGVAAIPVLFGSVLVVGALFHVFFPAYVSATNPLLELVQTPFDLVLFLTSSIYVGGFKEEIQRAFVLVRFEKYLGGILPGLVIWSAFFGFGHQAQGVDSAAGAGVLGFLFGALYVWRRNLVAPMVSHALYDMLTLLVFWRMGAV